ncbi:BCCT family transporter [Candidatus Puniceispirillum marinum]|uniref:BCCT transporter n=1 Tax=Puniceispirillum marinum (strain IMCC1322) TaxID=488538 RepID=D5BQY1_PUNMI|nr:BCCT family transporter [Candidatus Puniceispirillum marinum]ADE38695.1 BCCT transporter [Candidatus Puniceispirillum marinum IMCC1322]
MSINPPLTNLPIEKAGSGFYQGFNRAVTVGSKALIGALILWAAVFSDQAGALLSQINGFLLAHFGHWYMYVVAFYVVVCFILALWPRTGAIHLGQPDEKPEFSRFSWFSMMFGAGIGIGMLTYSTAEPIYHFSNNPDIIRGTVAAVSAENVRPAFQWSFLHWGLSAWACYALVGLALAFFSYSRGLPLTIRSGLTPLLGKSLSGPLGHAVDIVSVIATILGVSVTIGYGVSQFSSGMFNITGANWMMDAEGLPTKTAMILSLLIVMGASTMSAMSGVGRGIKWLSNLNMGLSLFILTFFILFGSTLFVFKSFFLGLYDYLIAFPRMSLEVWSNDGSEVSQKLADWQGGWTIFYWAWWIAFAPFVGLFLARISRGRSIREYVLGAMIVPATMCFVWFTFVGGTAIDLELRGIAGGQIMDAGISSQLFEMINIMLSPALATAMSVVIVILLLTFLVTSADSAVLIINTIAAGGDASQKGNVHIITWGAALTLVIAVLLLAGGLSAINTAMIIGALPFSFVMALMGISLLKALIRDGMRDNSKTKS